MARKPGELRLNRSDIGTGAISLQPRKFGPGTSKTRETRVSVKFLAANVPTPVAHNLGFVPSGYIVLGKFRGTGVPPAFTTPGDIYNDHPLPASRNAIVLKCTVAGTVADILVR